MYTRIWPQLSQLTWRRGGLTVNELWAQSVSRDMERTSFVLTRVCVTMFVLVVISLILQTDDLEAQM